MREAFPGFLNNPMSSMYRDFTTTLVKCYAEDEPHRVPTLIWLGRCMCPSCEHASWDGPNQCRDTCVKPIKHHDDSEYREQAPKQMLSKCTCSSNSPPSLGMRMFVQLKNASIPVPEIEEDVGPQAEAPIGNVNATLRGQCGH